jgi:hypothetical protein
MLPAEIQSHIKYINRLGLTVISLPKEITDNFNEDLFLREQREFINPVPAEDNFILGGFRAYGNGSAYHHPQIRSIRAAVYEHIVPLFQELYGNNYIELLPDRFARRNKLVPVTAESWHRDSSLPYQDFAKKGITNIIYGGWINLDKTQTQYFSFVPGSHKGVELKTGFAKITKEEAEKCEAKKKIIRIPPYSCIIFNELLRHEVIKIKSQNQSQTTSQFSCRLYQKYRISNAGTSLMGEANIRQTIHDQSPFNMHQNSLPPMYSKMHMICWRQRLVKFSENVHEAFKEQNTNTNKGTIIKRYFTGLRQAGLEMFPDYDEEKEVAILLPQPL